MSDSSVFSGQTRQARHPSEGSRDETLGRVGQALASSGEVRFVATAEALQLGAGAKRLVVRLEGAALGPAARGRLAEAIDEAIEGELAARGASAAGLGALGSAASAAPHDARERDADATLSDQLFRARKLGARGLCIVIGSLEALCPSPGCPLEPADAQTLTFLAQATRDRPLFLLLDSANEARTALTPVTLAVLLGVGTTQAAPSRAVQQAVKAVQQAVQQHAVQLAPSHEVEPAPVEVKPAYAIGASVSHASALDDWRHWTLQLTAARGPQPLAALERLFAQSYMPLTNAIAAGLDDPRALQAQDEFRRAFEKSYGEAFPTFAVTGKRPRMVLDAPEIAGRIARLHGARATQLLLVDSMRWDLGMQMKERLVTRFGARASLAEEMILWSALPTTTTRQMDTLARGLEALRPNANGTFTDGDGDADFETGAESLRGRTATIIRRLRIGRKDLHKLDLVASTLSDPARSVADADMTGLADDVAGVVLKHTESLGARTLLFIFGDHGFVRPHPRAASSLCGGESGANGTRARGRGRASASPEEVLVPAVAFLVGDVH